MIILVMEINQITEPSDKSPRFFRILCPVVPPRFLCPKSAKEQPKGKEYIAYLNKLVCKGKDRKNLLSPLIAVNPIKSRQ